MSESVDRLKSLRGAADTALAALKASPCEGAINWADLWCSQAMHVVDDDGYEFDEVLIQEASPGCENNRFRELIAEKLTAAGWDVGVRTEW